MKQARVRHPDFILCVPIVCLLALGLVMVRSASGIESLELFRNPDAIFNKQMVAAAIGMTALLILMHIRCDLYRHPVILYGAVLVVLALLVGVKFQPAANGAQRWYFIGGFGFQPSDVAKIVLMMFVAAHASKPKSQWVGWKERLIPIALVLIAFTSLIMWQPDFGTTMILIFMVGVMLFLAGLPIGYFVLSGIFLLPIVAGLVMTEGYRMQRIMDFRADKDHYQTVQSKIALGSGGLTGVGLGEGKQKLHFLPEPHTDFIFSTLGEEMGFVGTTFVVAMFLLFLWRSAIVLSRVESAHAQLLGAGIVLLILTQAFLNISVSLDLFPNKGLTLPFMSAGGTSLILCLAMCGILLNISRLQVTDNRELV
ncbi:MAG: cell division protein FtsW [Acidobacteria bacterium]|nr:cell division protein FtsW [Acidobacteriota bacterium]